MFGHRQFVNCPRLDSNLSGKQQKVIHFVDLLKPIAGLPTSCSRLTMLLFYTKAREMQQKKENILDVRKAFHTEILT